MKITRLFLAAGGVAAMLTLAGCWNDDDEPVATETAPVTAVPDSAGISTAAFVAFILTLGASDESSEPLTIRDTFAVPPDEATEPTPLT